MLIGGIQKISLSDYPGYSSCVIFTLGCNFRCGYCHDAEMVSPELHPEPITEEDVFDFLKKRRGLLDGVVVCGGEPTIHDDLPEFIEKIKKLGFLVKLDSNGTRPDMIKDLINKKLIDFVAMDIKGPLWKYSIITARPVDTNSITQSIKTIIKSGIGYEFRTTVVKELLNPKDFEEIGQLVKGAKRFALQKFVPDKTLNPHFANKFAYTDDEMKQLKTTMDKYVKECVVH